ncbi:ABC transporter permease [Lacticaseibacillus mingshuiensis]|uniref:ABC transporter permease n=1 Tax=Lacticaseibacillus mingshuiensis TaxID=2799574 RepID=A0ABW4CGY9_9LACO|nr:ABC transporter permease [Lacticaseibacillus mingshuiensis]
MINQMRADLYRQFHTLGYYLVVLATIALSALIVGFKSVGGVMIQTDTTNLDKLASKSWTAIESLQAATLSSSLLVYLYIGLFVILIGYEFSQKTYKNTLLSGISRLQFIFAKYVTLVVDMLVLIFIYYLTALAVNGLAGRSLGENLGTLLGNTATESLTIAFFISAVFSLAIVLLVATGSNVIASVFIALWPILIGVIEALTQWNWLKYFDVTGAAENIALGTLKVDALWPYLGTCIGLVLLSLVGSAAVIRHREL